MSDPFASPEESPENRKSQQRQDFIFDQENEAEHFNQKKKTPGKMSEIETVTGLSLAAFLLYTISLLIIMQLRIDFPVQLKVNKARSQFYLNQIGTSDSYIKRVDEQMSFYDIDRLSAVNEFIGSIIIPGIYTNIEGKVVPDPPSSADMIFYEVISNLRIKQKRAQQITQKGNARFPTRWNLDETLEDKRPYGNNKTDKITYDPEQGGYLINIQIPLLTLNQTQEQYKKVINNGFFDDQTREIQVDFVEYDGSNNFLVYFKMKFDLTPTGRIESSYRVTTFPIIFYMGKTGVIMLVFQVIFVLLSIYFLIIEGIKVNTHIQSATKSNDDPKTNEQQSKLAQFNARAKLFKEKLITILKGILNYLKSPWSLLDVVSLVCSFLDVYLWLDAFLANVAENYLNIISVKSTVPLSAQYVALNHFNQNVEATTKTLLLFRHVAAVNILILFIKLLKYIANLNKKIKEQVEVIVNVTSRLLPFIVLMLTILVAYIYLAYILYGDTMEEFSNYFSAFKYFLTNIHGQFNLMAEMYDVDSSVTLIFHILFIFIVSFILTNMFLIYVIHAFQDYVDAKRKQIVKKKRRTGLLDFEPHFSWKIRNFFKVQLPLLFSKVFQPKRYKEEVSNFKDEQIQEEKTLSSFSKFNFDLNIENQDNDSKDLNIIFNAESTIRKIKKQQNMNTVKLIWKTLALMLLFIIMTIVAMEHHKIKEGESMAQGISEILNLKSLIEYNQTANTITKFSFGQGITQLQNFRSAAYWVYLLFPKFASYGNITLKGNVTYEGYFFPGDSLLIGSSYALTFRRRNIIPLDDGAYDGLSKYTLGSLFDAGALKPAGEDTQPINGNGTGKTYNYSEDTGYMNAGGYIFSTIPGTIQKDLEDLYLDGMFGLQTNSFVLECLLLTARTQNLIKLTLVFQINKGVYLDSSVNIQFVGANYYQEGYQYIIGILEVIIVCWSAVTFYQIISSLKKKNFHYNYWYSLYISNFDRSMKVQREKKKPEFLRKLEYVLDFSNIINIGVNFFTVVSAIIWIYYLINVTRDFKEAEGLVRGTASINSGELAIRMNRDSSWFSALKLSESITLLLLSVKILYYYSYFSRFHFLTKAIRKSIRVTPQMAIIAVIILFAFGFFLQLIRGTSDENFSESVTLLTHMLKIWSKLGSEDILYLTENYDVFVTLVFYVPWVLFAFCVIFNMFLGVVLSAYKTVNDNRIEKHESISFKEFFMYTYELLTKKNTASQTEKIHFEVNEQTKAKFNLEKIFDLFADMAEMASSFRNVFIWSTTCSQLITNESECRKMMKRISKSITKASIIDFDFRNHVHKKILSDNEKFSQFNLRMKYWSYFVYGRAKLLECMNMFQSDLQSNTNEIGNNIKRRIHQKVDVRIQKYVASLEEKVSKNIRDVQMMRSKLGEYAKEIAESK